MCVCCCPLENFRTEDEGEADQETLRLVLRLQCFPVVVAFSRAPGQSLKLGLAQVVAPKIAEQRGKMKGTWPTRRGTLGLGSLPPPRPSWSPYSNRGTRILDCILG